MFFLGHFFKDKEFYLKKPQHFWTEKHCNLFLEIETCLLQKFTLEQMYI